MLLLLKVALPMALVAIISLASRWFGPTIGGLLMGLPWMTGPLLIFLALDKGEAFAADACAGIELGIICVAVFMLTYGAVSTLARWPMSVIAGGAAFAGSALAIKDAALTLPQAAAAAAASLLLTYLLLPRPHGPPATATLPWWDIPARMLSTFALVAAILISADFLGPRLSGIISTYPVVTTVICAFTHHQWGRDAVRRILRALALSLLAFIAFFLIVGLSMPAVGLAASFAIATAVVLFTQGLFLALMQGSARAS
jgi:hypothetical protein